jgi:hypothetical protein
MCIDCESGSRFYTDAMRYHLRSDRINPQCVTIRHFKCVCHPPVCTSCALTASLHFKCVCHPPSSEIELVHRARARLVRALPWLDYLSCEKTYGRVVLLIQVFNTRLYYQQTSEKQLPSHTNPPCHHHSPRGHTFCIPHTLRVSPGLVHTTHISSPLLASQPCARLLTRSISETPSMPSTQPHGDSATLQRPQAKARATHRGITGGHTLTQDGRDRLTGQPPNSLRHFLGSLRKSGISVESSLRSMLGKSQVFQEGLCFPYAPYGMP